MPEQQQHHISQEVVQYSSSPSSHSDGSSIASSLDELAKGLANGTLSRGKALRLVGGALLGSALGSIPGVAWADDRCSEGQTRCGDRCVNLQTNERHCGSCSNRCAEGEECVSGVCQGACLSNGVSCTDPSQCCSGICESSTCVACRSNGSICTANSECCSGNCS